jgi:hypothetical protein
MDRPARAIALCLFAVAGGCAQTPPLPACARLGGEPMLEYELFFGRGITGHAQLTEQEWADFAARVITPRLPNGFTAIDADGQWMNPTTQRIVKERSKLLVVALPDTPQSASAIAAIKDAYRAQFHQQLVGMTVHPTCAAF